MATAYITDARYAEHDLPGHPEHAGRIRAVWRELETSGLHDRLQRLEPLPASLDLIQSVHTPAYLDLLARIEAADRPMLYLDPDTYFGRGSYEIARLAAGGVVRAVDAVMAEGAANALAVVRPPGHHAMPDRAMGFCILGNVPIAARHAQAAYGLQRVMIVDFDVHHGNGTEAMFYDDDSVLFISSHQSPFYPGTGALTDTGAGRGRGYTLNIPLASGHGDASYAALFERVIYPAAARFQPELLLVSAGFDAHWSDPLAGMRLSLTGYAQLCQGLRRIAEQFCAGRVVFALEGGYNLEALSHGVRNIAHVLLGDSEVSDPLGPPPDGRAEPDIEPLLNQIRAVHGL